MVARFIYCIVLCGAPSRSEELIQLQTIVQLPPTAAMIPKDEELLWKFRYFLSESNPLALLKFCR